MDKTVSQFLPLSTVTADEADQYYLQVHTRFARHFLREMEQVVSYHINRAVAEYELVGLGPAPARVPLHLIPPWILRPSGRRGNGLLRSRARAAISRQGGSQCSDPQV
ncbi:hypothetical protein OHA79_03030 [Streptomyces sp. NBC_00841]|uniref:hypothetical protein n=1 Tax=Streptomyces sp. NBC_00841 TaxID=2975847 RepID=UPI002DD8DEDB|nr:hypothetical protein [Streptomyces sp. NBC_00841]WRZ96988.1 hypothetical protein OHA79_03030 [Streptomyces sp. NBC_00841]